METKYYFFIFGLIVIIAVVVIASNQGSSSNHTLRFGTFDLNGKMKYYILDGDVYINDIYSGKTKNGILDIKNCVDGQVEFVPDMTIKLKENDKPKFQIYCDTYLHDFPLDKQEHLLSELSVASKFIQYLAYTNELVRKNAVELTRDCKVNDKVCMSNEIFNTIVKSIKYVDDPRDIDHVQSVPATLNIKAGDCEDFTVLLSTYLESVGIKTRLILTNNHIYTLVCGLDYDDIKAIIPAGKPFFYYAINNENCFVADPTIPNSYLGYSANIKAEKIAVDPITKDYYVLDSSSQ